MKRVLTMALGATAVLGSVPACSPVEQDRAPYTLNIDDPVEGNSSALSFDMKISIDGDFTLHESDCDASNVEVGAPMQALWSPYDCTDEDGQPAEGQGNVQVFVNGIFEALGTSSTVEVDLSPVLSYAYYEPMADVDGDGEDDNFFMCNFYFPDDNLHYASMFYDATSYTLEDYGIPLYDPSTLTPNPDYDPDTESPTYDPREYLAEPMSEPQVIVDAYFDWVTAVPWMGFDYLGFPTEVYTEEYYDWFFEIYDTEGYFPVPDSAGLSHQLSAQLNYDNHSPVYGVSRAKVDLQGFDFSSMPEDWCGFGPFWFFGPF